MWASLGRLGAGERKKTKRRHLGDPCGAFGRPLVPFSVPLGALWMIFVIVIANHVLDSFRIDNSTVLGTIVASYLLYFLIVLSNIFKLTDLCKCRRLTHGSIVFDVLAHWILMIL